MLIKEANFFLILIKFAYVNRTQSLSLLENEGEGIELFYISHLSFVMLLDHRIYYKDSANS